MVLRKCSKDPTKVGYLTFKRVCQNGRLFSAGPGSYILADQNLWDNHTGIVNMVQDIEYVDGFQFFSNGTWEDYQYWQEAGNTFFEEKTIIRHLPEYENTHWCSAKS